MYKFNAFIHNFVLLSNYVLSLLIYLRLRFYKSWLCVVFQSGLSGSSGIVCAALNCFLDFYKVRDLIKVEVRPNLILAAEKELGIVAGLQDRVAQVYGGIVYMVHCLITIRSICFQRVYWVSILKSCDVTCSDFIGLQQGKHGENGARYLYTNGFESTPTSIPHLCSES
jgi:hypothetical protein